MHDYHPHLPSGLSFLGSGVAALAAVSVRATHAMFASGSAWSFDDAKWAISTGAAVAFGAFGVYAHFVERWDKHRQKRLRIDAEGRAEREAIEHAAQLARDRAAFEEKMWEKRVEAEVQRRLEAAKAASTPQTSDGSTPP